MFHKFGSKYRRALVAAASLPMLAIGSLARAADESGIVTTDLVAVITDGKAKGLVLALAVLSMVIVFKIVRKVSSAV